MQSHSDPATAELTKGAQRPDAERYGRRKVSKMYAEVNALRALIRSEGTPGIQLAWDAVEEHIDFAYAAAKGGE